MSHAKPPPLIINTGASRNECKLPEWDAALKQQHAQAAPWPSSKPTHGAPSTARNGAPSSNPQPMKKRRIAKVDYSTLASDPPSQPLAKMARKAPAAAPATTTTTRPARASTPPLRSNAPFRTTPPLRTTPPARTTPPLRSTPTPPRSSISGILAARNRSHSRTPPAHPRAGRSRDSKQAAAGRAHAVVPSDKSGPTRAQQATAQMQEALERMRTNSARGGKGGVQQERGGKGGVQGTHTSSLGSKAAAGRGVVTPGSSKSTSSTHASSAATIRAKAHQAAHAKHHAKHHQQGPSQHRQGPSDRHHPHPPHRPAPTAHNHAPTRKQMQDQEEEEEGEEEGDWRAALRAVTGYDPRRYREVGGMGSDRAMEASVRDIMREERRSAVLGKKADIEEERAEEERRKAKLAKKRKLQ